MKVDALRNTDSGGNSSPSGQHRREAVRVQRGRIILAAKQLLREQPAEELTIASVRAVAGVSRTRFADSFADRDALLLATFDDVARCAGAAMERARRSESSWLDGVRAGLIELLRLFDEDPGLARFLVAGSLAGNTRLLARRARAVSALALALEDGAPVLSGETLPAPFGGEAVVGAVVAILHARLLEEPSPSLAPLGPSLMSVIALPYLGVTAARGELVGGLSSPPPKTRASPSRLRAPVGAEAVGRRGASRREIQALAAIEERPGLTNREVAAAVKISDPAQASRLLGRLHRRGLLKDDAANRRGPEKAWRLTSSGAQALAAGSPQIAKRRTPGRLREDL
jgi:AcrR family transcriptional regulator